MMSINTSICNYTKQAINLAKLLEEISIDEWQYQPNRGDGWSICQHIMHLIHAEIQSTMRNLMFINKDKTIIPILENKEYLKYLSIDGIKKPIMISVLKSLCEFNKNIISNVVDVEKRRNKVNYYYNDEKDTLSIIDNIESSIEHIKYHKEYIDNNLLEYKELF